MSTTFTPQEIEQLSIHAIARIIRSDWDKVTHRGTPTPFGNMGQNPANPYWAAMMQMQDIDAAFGLDDGREIVMRFLANATGWRGETARMVKKELKRRLGVK